VKIDIQITKERDRAVRALGIIHAGLTHLTAATPIPQPPTTHVRITKTAISNPTANNVEAHLHQTQQIRSRLRHGHPLTTAGTTIGHQTGLADDLNHINNDLGYDLDVDVHHTNDHDTNAHLVAAYDRTAQNITNAWIHRLLSDDQATFAAQRFRDLHEDHIRWCLNRIYDRIPLLHPNAGQRPRTCNCDATNCIDHQPGQCQDFAGGRCRRCRYRDRKAEAA